jgi:chorismate synthase
MGDVNALSDMAFPVLDATCADRMKSVIENAAADGDSVGGILETAVVGCPFGVGEPWFDTVEGMLSHALFSIPAIKGVEFGEGFGFASLMGSEANDPFRYVDGRVITETNKNGGINGGITNGMPIIFRCSVKPTPSIYKPQSSVDLEREENVTLEIKGRHDPAIIHRARIVVDSIAALVLADMLTARYGADYLASNK